MQSAIVSIRIPEEDLAALDAIANAQGMDRNTVIQTAIGQHIAHYHWSCRHIQKALEDPELADEAEVAAELAEWKASL
ncbi:ribbon-helix-helix domain-containing protein [Gloeobacter morelensis]|uniref:Ribbon-helix-helix protein, CopG family n=1 Tax=Gloeobacter morelensis MG652769 TaxID=2781736 RepID=A0ABY3PRM6_9CYAN|nr:ribbon-helix-helix domain-containing protein [Gloeobacter morelensis]UFP96371.1 ribbon-helix-helix protein, CopG family [Gloeobacter morelensis MG652769]